jgi:intein/homing endonuclease
MEELITNIEELDYDIEMIDIEVNGNHLFFANNILTHNSNSDIEITDTSECIAITEKVQMRDGSIKTIDDIKIGDQITANDEYKTVMFRHHNKIKDCIKIRTLSGKEIIISKDHVFPTLLKDGTITRMSYNDGLSIGDVLNTK